MQHRRIQGSNGKWRVSRELQKAANGERVSFYGVDLNSAHAAYRGLMAIGRGCVVLGDAAGTLPALRDGRSLELYWRSNSVRRGDKWEFPVLVDDSVSGVAFRFDC